MTSIECKLWKSFDVSFNHFIWKLGSAYFRTFSKCQQNSFFEIANCFHIMKSLHLDLLLCVFLREQLWRHERSLLRYISMSFWAICHQNSRPKRDAKISSLMRNLVLAKYYCLQSRSLRSPWQSSPTRAILLSSILIGWKSLTIHSWLVTKLAWKIPEPDLFTFLKNSQKFKNQK